ncbi:MAG: hydrogenase [Myxococcales bacterium]|nr:hydrogenase [Myxococcales bacterium]
MPWRELRSAIVAAVAYGGKLMALFGHRAAGSDSPAGSAWPDLWAVVHLGARDQVCVGRARLTAPRFDSMTPELAQAHLFEREIAEQFSIDVLHHPWLKPVRYPPQPRPVVGAVAAGGVGSGAFYEIEGPGVHEVAVGPVHAGVIESGHFRFQCWGEHVHHLEIALGYQHRGVERALESGPAQRRVHLVETVAGDTTIGHATAYARVCEAVAGTVTSGHAEGVRALALELERMANHVGDLGALAGDVGYLPTQSFCGRLRGDFLNLSQQLCGSRFGRGLVVPGGVRVGAEPSLRRELLAKLDAAVADVDEAVNLLWESASVMARFDGTGVLTKLQARELGVVGPAARASGLERDARDAFPAGTAFAWRAHWEPVTERAGDVAARTHQRAREVEQSAATIRWLVAQDDAWQGPAAVPCGTLPPDHIAVGIVEGWRGEIVHVGITAPAGGGFCRYKIVDPSFHGWSGLALAMRGQAISDFPLCNKSFNLSYCGFDL